VIIVIFKKKLHFTR